MTTKFVQAITEITQSIEYINDYYLTTMPDAIKYQILKIQKNVCELELIEKAAQRQHTKAKIEQYIKRMQQCVK